MLMTPGGVLVALVAGGLAAVGVDNLIKYYSGKAYDLL